MLLVLMVLLISILLLQQLASLVEMCSAPRFARVLRLRENYRIEFELMRLRFRVLDVDLVLSQLR